MTTNKNHWSYLAALYDGEGCIHIARQFQPRSNCYGYRLDMPVGMTSLGIMKWLVQHFGGVYYTKRIDVRFKNAKQCYSWLPKGKKNKELILLGILPYLIEKREQAEVALEFLRLPWGTGEEKDRLHLLCRALKKESLETNTSESTPVDKIESELVGDYESEPVVTQDLQNTLVTF